MRERQLAIGVNSVSLSYLVRSGFLKWSRYYPLRNISFDIFRGETLSVGMVLAKVVCSE